jgi:3D (Asp-Asp-Asp) domain-containing protein
VTPGNVLGLALVGLLVMAAPGLAGMLGTAVTGVPDPSSSAASATGSGDSTPMPQTQPSAERTPLQRRSAEAASRSRVSSTPTGSPLSVTAYCYTGHRTASGVWPREGMAAGNRWPFGTRLDVESVGTVVVTDRIGHGSDLDLYMPRCADAVRFGRRELIVEVER